MSGHELLLKIAGGVALLLWATRLVRTGIMRAYGAEVRRVLARSFDTRLGGFAIGLGVAALLQSSTATALLLVSFASRGLVAAGAGLGVMLGADVGSTMVVQAMSFNIGWLSPALVLLGVFVFLSSEARSPRQIGRILVGLGLMLLSLQLIVEAAAPLANSKTLHTILAPLARDPILAVLLGALLAWLAHSSVATVLLVMSLATVGVVPLPLGLALVLGANVGSGIVPVVLTLKGAPEGRRIPLGNLGFRLLGALAALPFIPVVAGAMAQLGASPTRDIANFHTLFNLALAALFLPLVPAVGRLMERLLPKGPEAEGPSRPRYLDPTALDTPPVAIACATREVLRMADTVESMLKGTIEVFAKDDAKLAQRISKLDDDVDRLHEAIKLYLTQVSRNNPDEADSRRCMELIAFTINLEHIGDIIDKNLMELAQKKIRNRLNFSDPGWAELKELHSRVAGQMQLAMSVFVSGDLATARQLIREKEQFRTLESQASERHLERLKSGRPESIESSALHIDILRDLKRINSHLSSVAYPILDSKGELRPSRLKAGVGKRVAQTVEEAASDAIKPARPGAR
jgi:phosphate:Na+ symporter